MSVAIDLMVHRPPNKGLWTIKAMNLSKLEPLDGTNYRRWSQKLLIFFEQLEVDNVLTTNLPTSDPPTTTSTSSDSESSTGPLTTVAVTD
ncbi:ty1-copia retrotransposon protein [Cucumis melo var. makuwa]|uniref:Ty1-copia retrotransposon protein n=1 Tax=Cucumis melo var. makuwa TaxID=1194695 RepID=A0A5A7TAJ9_CUCMM|nr:ty1-copia retrotransposon protein [Cucumis melo var. makuwa]TYK23468.1 ty1-copia retrotransposon protein [Cucumis melo var. makuwa]